MIWHVNKRVKSLTELRCIRLKFAHISDIHLGFQKEPVLQKIEEQVFEDVLDKCMSLHVDFILMPGDIFHTNIPDMRVQKYAFEKFRQVHEAGIPVYVVYGSHDFSPISESVIDLLVSTGYIIRVTNGTTNEDGRILLEFTLDPQTKVKIVGMSGLKRGRDRDEYILLDRVPLESEPGFKIFLFHGGIAEMKDDPTNNEGDLMPLSLLPKGFSYYAGGHMHTCRKRTFDHYSHVVYPGTPFAGHPSDLENNALGVERGFFVVEFQKDVESIDFIPTKNAQCDIIQIDAKDKSSESVNKLLHQNVDKLSPEGKIVIVKIFGEMTNGKTSDIETPQIVDTLERRGALVARINRNQLRSKEYSIITPSRGINNAEIESNIFSENIGQLQLDAKNLTGESGVSVAKHLLSRLGSEQLANEKKFDYATRIKKDGLATLNLS